MNHSPKNLDDLKHTLAAYSQTTPQGHRIWTGATASQNQNIWGYLVYKGRTLTAQRAAMMVLLDTEIISGQVRKDKMKCSEPLCIDPLHHYIPKKVNKKSDQSFSSKDFETSNNNGSVIVSNNTIEENDMNWISAAIQALSETTTESTSTFENDIL